MTRRCTRFPLSRSNHHGYRTLIIFGHLRMPDAFIATSVDHKTARSCPKQRTLMTETGSPQPAGPTGDSTHALAWLDRWVWLLLPLAPFIFASVTWDPWGNNSLLQAILRSLSLPITIIEMIVIFFALMTGLRLASSFRRMPVWVRIVLAILIAIALLTTIFVAQDRAAATVRTYAWAIHLLFGFSLCDLFETRWSQLRPFVWPSVVGGTLLYMLAVIALVLAIPDEQLFNWKGFGLGVTHIRQVAFYSIVGAGASLGLAAITNNRFYYWAAIVAATLLLALSFWSGTRGSLLAVFVAFGTGWILLRPMRNWAAIGALVASYTAGGLLSLAHQPPHPFYGLFRISRSTAVTGADKLATGRLTQWQESARAIWDRPLFGYGESQYGHAVPGWDQFNHPHNIFLQLLIQWGMLGAACFLALTAYLGWHFVKRAQDGSPQAIPAFLAAAGLATMSLYEGSLYHPYPVMMLVVAIAFVFSAKDKSLA
ncbi:O-antigen ligase family protein [Sphingosinicella rhizophila]|uniref:O-antigen ligase family protein n=1 Tax=Sphingosinicella rhizophila TaxID=3050082 RepID=A0ABU3Q3L4_9SPHN|nr:O-antigen ligase family protein [Sphingosinicella sp. GR2756]MDT9598008.1 O-antigen ligase family protein [Sphingosinicella sp. GR2756]